MRLAPLQHLPLRQ